MLILEYTITGTAAYIVKNKKKGRGGGAYNCKTSAINLNTTCGPFI